MVYKNINSYIVQSFRHLRAHLSKLLFVVSVYFVYFFFTTGRVAFAFPVAGAVFGSLIAWMAITYSSYEEQFLTQKVTPTALLKIATGPKVVVTTLCLYIATILVLYSNALYHRPTIMYPLHGAICGYIALCIFFDRSKILNLLQIFVVAVATYWSSQLLFPAGTISNASHARMGEQILQIGIVPESYTYSYHPGFTIQTGTFSEITGLPILDSYSLLAVLIVAGAAPILGSLDRVVPSLSSRAAQFGALIFITASFTLNRGLLPHTTSFFYVHLAILLVVIFAALAGRHPSRFVIIGLFVIVSMILGHTFSAGAPVTIVIFGAPLLVLYHLLPVQGEGGGNYRSMGIFIALYTVGLFAHQMFYEGSGHLLGRVGSVFLSFQELFFGTGTGGGGSGTSGGIYSDLSTGVLFQATVGDMFLFSLLFAGICVMFAQEQYDLDILVLLVGSGFGVMAVGVLVHAGDIPAQRFYHVIIVFGGSAIAGIGLLAGTNVTPSDFRVPVLVGVVALFAIFSLFSPVASVALTPLEVPHSDGDYTTAHAEASEEWSDEFGDIVTFRDTPFSPVDDVTVTVDRSQMEPGELYTYDEIYAESGVQVSGASEFGQAEYSFVEPSPDMTRDNRVYDGGSVSIQERE